MPNRIVREGILTSERVNALTPNAELFYRRLMSVVDDFGRFSANPTLLRGSCYPLKLDSVKEDSISKHLAECVGARLIVLYTVADKAYLQLLDFAQQIRAAKSKYPAPSSDCAADAQQVLSKRIAHAPGDGDVDGGVLKDSASPAGESPIPYAEIVGLYNSLMASLPKVREVNNDRKTAVRKAWQASEQRRSLEFWKAYFEECAEDPFLNGAGPYKPPHENWRPDFEYLMRGKVVTKVYERAMDRMERGNG